MISVNGLTKNYDDLTAVDNISFSIRIGEITGLLGPNGAGKTTTLRMLTCYLKPTAGKITVGDFLVDESPLEVKKLIGYLPENAPIYGDMVVYDYLKYVGTLRGTFNGNINDRLMEIADICSIDEVMHKNVSELSKGFKQRVGLAHAMLHDPEILILDEPTSGLDPNQIVEIRNLIKKIGKKKTVILSTHILSEVEATCDRVIIIDRGKIVADGSTSELKSSQGGAVNVSVKLDGDSKTISGEIKRIEGVNDVSEFKDEEGLISLNIASSGKTDIRPLIFKLAGEKGWTLYEMKQEQRTLENIFRELTKGGKNEV